MGGGAPHPHALLPGAPSLSSETWRRCSATNRTWERPGDQAHWLQQIPHPGSPRRPSSRQSLWRIEEASLWGRSWRLVRLVPEAVSEANRLRDRAAFGPLQRFHELHVLHPPSRAGSPRRIFSHQVDGAASGRASSHESAPDLVRPGASSTSGSKSSASKEASSSSKEVEEVSAPQGRRSKGKLLKSSRTSPSLPLIDVGSDLGGVRFEPGEGTPTSEFPMRQRRSGDRFGSDEWEGAPVKPRPQGLLVTAMRSQEWMSQVA